MGHGFVSDPGQLTSLATTVYRLRQNYDAVTVRSRTEGEPLGSLDVESGVTTIQTTWSRKQPEIGQLLDQMATGLFAAAKEDGWTEERARRNASDNPDGSSPGGSHPGSGGGGGSGSPGGGMSGSPTGTGDPTSPGGPVDTDGDGTPDYRDTDSDNDGIPDSVEKGGNPDASASPDSTMHPGDTTATGRRPWVYQD